MKPVRLDKFLAQMQVGTRTEVKKYIKKGLIGIDGVTAVSPEQKVIPDQHNIIYRGKLLKYEAFVYYMLYKPMGCVTAREDRLHPTVMEYIPSGRMDLSPVGRLDLDTEGLLLVTNDGALSHALLSPTKHVKKTYEAKILGDITNEDIRIFLEGIDIGDKKRTKPAVLTILASGETSYIRLTITEGRFHQVKRMFQALGKQVIYLKRIRMGALWLDESLSPGDCRKLTVNEIEKLRNREDDSVLNGIKAIIFDMDGTLVDSMWMWRDIDIDFLKGRNIPYEDDIQEKIEGMSFTETAAYFKEYFSLEDSVEELKQIWNDMAMHKYLHEVPLKPGVKAFLKDMKARNIKLGIATSNSRELVDALASSYEFDKYFSSIVTSCSVKKGKPAPDVYLEAARQLDVKPEECLVFEDIVKGIEAGKNAGMRVCGIFDDYSRKQDEKKREICDYYIHSYDEVPR